MAERVLITAALLYANGPLHFGHLAGAYLPADCYARYMRLKGNQVHFISGSDEYGMAITMSAELAQRTPEEHVEIYHKMNLELFKKLNFSFDHYARTTWPEHKKTVHEFFTDLYEKGLIEARVTDQLYSPSEQRFLADRYVVGCCPKCSYANARGDECPSCGASYDAVDLVNPRSKLSDSPLERRPTKHWFLLLDKFKDQLLKWLETKRWKSNVASFVRGYIEDLHPRAITRDMKWGVSVPLEEASDKVLYVWFDAPIGYISASKEWAVSQGDPDLWQSWWLDPKTRLVHFIGKDNIPFHAAIFPAMVMGQNTPYKLVDDLPANEFYRLEGRQFSKSDGWFIDLDDFLKRYNSDLLRYFLAVTAPESSDAEFTWDEFFHRCNSELVGKYGNLAQRVLLFLQKQCDGKVPAKAEHGVLEDKLFSDAEELVAKIAEAYEGYHLRRAAKGIMELAQLGNVYFDHNKPWVLAKEGKTERLHIVLRTCLELLKTIAVASSPITPLAAQQLWQQLGMSDKIEQLGWEKALAKAITAKEKLPQPSPLFSKISEEQIKEEKQKLYGSLKVLDKGKEEKKEKKQAGGVKNETAHDNLITFEQFKQAQLRVAQIRQVEKVAKSAKLYKLTLFDGEAERTVVAGIAEQYDQQFLLGKKVALVSNLKPAKLMGIESHGMLLAARSSDGNLELITFQTAAPGSVIS